MNTKIDNNDPRKRGTKKLLAKAVSIVLVLSLSGILFGCASPGALDTTASNPQTASSSTTTPTETTTVDTSGRITIQSDASVMDAYDWTFSDRDLDPSYDEVEATMIDLSDAGSTIEGSGATSEGSTITISEAGVYVLSGSLSDGSVLVDLPGEEDKTQLVLDGVTITCSNGPAILVENADKVFITLADGSENTLADGGTHEIGEDENDHDGVIFSHDDLTLNGSGSLTVKGNYDNGIVGKNDVRITGGDYSIEVVGHGIQGKDCIKIIDGFFSITCGADGLHASNDEDEMLGYLGVGAGAFTIAAGDDAFHADSAILIAGGTIDITQSYEGYEGRTISVTGGTSTIVASDDGLNAATGSEMTDNQGFMGPEAGGERGGGPQGGGTPPDMQDPAQNTDAQVVNAATDENEVSESVATQTTAYATEGSTTITQAAVTSSDCFLEITGGSLYVKAGGDGIDSNGNLSITGGDIIVECVSAGGDSALDCDGTATISGGSVIAVGPTGMAEGFDTSEQASLIVSVQSIATGTPLAVLDSSGAEIYSFTPTETGTSLVLSTPDLKVNETYTITNNAQTLAKATAALSTNTGMGAPGGGGNGVPGF